MNKNKLWKSILLILVNIVSIPLSLLATAGIIWYTLPALKLTIIGKAILSVLSPTVVFWITIVSAVLCTVLYIIQGIFNKNLSSKLKNLFIHINTWAIAIVATGLSIATFILVNPLVGKEIAITVPRKISIGTILICLILFHLFSKKLSLIVNRRIQAYETAKESNLIGRGSVVLTNFLKLFEIFFPEMLILALVCCCVSWSVASYFIIVLSSSFIPMIGNIICDFNARSELKKLKEKNDNDLVNKVVNQIKGDEN